MLPENGIVSFIKMKLNSSVPPEEIKGMLLRAGFHTEHIDHAFRFVRERYPEAHQEVVASNGFLPDLSKKGVPPTAPAPLQKGPAGTTRHTQAPRGAQSSQIKELSKSFKSKIDENFVTHKGLFQGRLRRKDFTLGFIFFFAVGYVVLTLSAVAVSIASPELWTAILSVIEHDTNGVLLVTVPVILAPVTIMMLSLITRRLHNLGLPGSLSWLFLVLFIPLDIRSFPGMWFLYIALGILFIVLLSKKGVPTANMYGDFPESKGSFFKRIFNV